MTRGTLHDAPGEPGARHRQAGLTDPVLRVSEASSSEDSPLTTDISESLASDLARCFAVAAMASLAEASATLKYWNEGAPGTGEPIHLAPTIVGASSGEATVTWTTQPAGDALSIMHAVWGASDARAT